MQNTPSTSTDLSTEVQAPGLVLVEEKPWASSLDIAKVFEKEHKHVLRDIRELAEKLAMTMGPNLGACSLKFEGMVKEFEVEVAIGNGAYRKSPAFLVNKDFFTLLAMGFSGDKALKFKLVYLQAFNDMEKALSEPLATRLAIAKPPTPQELISAISSMSKPPVVQMSVEQAEQLEEAHSAHRRATKDVFACTNLMHKHFNGKPTADQFQAAMVMLVMDAAERVSEILAGKQRDTFA